MRCSGKEDSLPSLLVHVWSDRIEAESTFSSLDHLNYFQISWWKCCRHLRCSPKVFTDRKNSFGFRQDVWQSTLFMLSSLELDGSSGSHFHIFAINKAFQRKGSSAVTVKSSPWHRFNSEAKPRQTSKANGCKACPLSSFPMCSQICKAPLCQCGTELCSTPAPSQAEWGTGKEKLISLLVFGEGKV